MSQGFELGDVFTRCSGCGMLVLQQVWEHAVGWDALVVPCSPVFGWEHHCAAMPSEEDDDHA